MTDHKKQRKDKPAHKENEAIEFEFNIGVDYCNEIATTLYKSGWFFIQHLNCRLFFTSYLNFRWYMSGIERMNIKKIFKTQIFKINQF